MARPRSRKNLTPPEGLPDYLFPGMHVLFVGINPGLRSAAVGHHFAGHSNRFWKLLYDSRLVSTPLTYRDDYRLPEWGLGLTNIVSRPTAGIDTLTKQDYLDGQTLLVQKIKRYRPKVIALLGVTVLPFLLSTRGGHPSKTPSSKHTRTLGWQAERVEDTPVFLLPNPSGRNAHYSYQAMRQQFATLAHYVTLHHDHEPDSDPTSNTMTLDRVRYHK